MLLLERKGLIQLNTGNDPTLLEGTYDFARGRTYYPRLQNPPEGHVWREKEGTWQYDDPILFMADIYSLEALDLEP